MGDNYRITYGNDKGVRFSYIVEEPEAFQEGIWRFPFPNSPGNSLAFGLVETLVQSDYCPQDFREDPVTFVMVERAQDVPR